MKSREIYAKGSVDKKELYIEIGKRLRLARIN